MPKEYHFYNLVFEGGGVKGIAYAGALEVLEQKGILSSIQRVAGTSAGAITAALLALGFSPAQITTLLVKTDFSQFKDDSLLPPLNALRLFKRYGWYKGSAFKRWFSTVLAAKVSPTITFGELAASKEKGFRELYVIGTHVNRQEAVIFSHESHPQMQILDAVRISMSIPLFFQAVRHNDELFVDGGIYYNYPLNLFDSSQYVANEQGEKTPYNKQTLGLRVDTLQEIGEQRASTPRPAVQIASLKEYLSAFVGGLIDLANKRHLREEDWHRTVYIDSMGIGTTRFDLSSQQKDALLQSGRDGAQEYFAWFDAAKGKDKPLNK